MQPPLEAEPSPRSPSFRRFSWLGGFLGPVLRRAEAWQWLPALLKLVAAGAGLLLLGAIGTSARARGVLGDAAPAAASSLPAAAIVGTSQTTGDASPSATPSSAPSASIPRVTAPSPGDGGAPAVPQSPRGRATPDDPVYLNEAALADLRRLPGVGAKRAEAILALRARLGHFRQLEDLLKVKGIGRSSLKKLRPLVRLDVPPARGDADGG